MSDIAMRRTVFEHLPLIALVVDDDMRIIDMNPAAEAAFGTEREVVQSLKNGDAFNCANSFAAPGGCGAAPACTTCVLRGSVRTLARTGRETTRRRHAFTLWRNNAWETIDLLVTATPVDYDGRRLSLLLLEDVTEVTALRGIIPICVKCGKVRDGEEYWQQVETYLCDTLGADLSHGVCPSCLPAYAVEFMEDAKAS